MVYMYIKSAHVETEQVDLLMIVIDSWWQCTQNINCSAAISVSATE